MARRIISIILIIFTYSYIFSQETKRIEKFSVEKNEAEVADSLRMKSDTTSSDSVSNKLIKVKVEYSSEDSLVFDVTESKAFLYNNAFVKRENTELKSGFVQMNSNEKTLFAKALSDTSETGKPDFKDGGENFTSNTIKYNYVTKKGIITDIVTKSDQGYILGGTTKKQGSGHVHVCDGRYTTCDHTHDPHFYIKLRKAKVIPNDKIVTNKAQLYIMDVPTPLIIPFGFFPNTSRTRSGILIPKFKDEQTRGLSFTGGGYYFAISDYFDMTLTSELFVRGSWGANLATRYKKRYRYDGNFTYNYNKIIVGDEDVPSDYSETTTYKILWRHTQDAKANPSSNFSANVNYSSSNYNTHNILQPTAILNSQVSSSISYSKRWPGTPFSMSLSSSAQQNTQTKMVNVSLPTATFNMSKIMPFKNEKRVGKARWYEKIGITYNAQMQNTANASEDAVFNPDSLDYYRSGFKHSVPLSVSLKALKYFTISPSLNYNGIFYNKSINKEWDEDLNRAVVTDTINKFYHAYSLDPNLSISFNPKFFGMFSFISKRSKVKAIRHVVSPSVSLSLKPKSMSGNYYETYDQVTVDSKTGEKTITPVEYSIFEQNIYGTPTRSDKSGSVNFSLKQNLEMKIRKDVTDTTEAKENFKKIKLIDNLNFSTGYNIYADSLNWSPISMSASTRLFDKININMSANMDQYMINKATGQKINKLVWSEGNLPKLRSASLSTGLQFPMKTSGSGKGKNESDNDKNNPAPNINNEYNYFDAPWTLGFNYSMNYSNNYLVAEQRYKSNFRHNLQMNGTLKLTKNTDIRVNSGYNFETEELTHTSITISRDLHCWNMNFTWVPMGTNRNFMFLITVKAAMLQDLKWEKRKTRYDYEEF